MRDCEVVHAVLVSHKFGMSEMSINANLKQAWISDCVINVSCLSDVLLVAMVTDSDLSDLDDETICLLFPESRAYFRQFQYAL